MPPQSIQPQLTIAASYERISRLVQAQHGYSLAAQHLGAEEFAAAQGWELPDQFRFRDGELDNASGVDWDLPGLTAMLDAARNGEFSVLIVPDLDRFARTMVKGLVLEEQLRNYGVRVVYQRVPLEDTPEGRLLKNQLYSFAEYEREKTRLRTITGLRQKAKSGQVIGRTHPPYGYRHVVDDRGKRSAIEPDPVTALVVQRIYRQLLTDSDVVIMNDLNREGVPSPRGGRWHRSVVAQIARSTTYAGKWQFAGIDVKVPPLVDRELWDRVQVARSERRTSRSGRMPKEQDPYLLRSRLTCGHCQSLLNVENNNGYRYYFCPAHYPSRAHKAGKEACELPAVNADAIHGELWKRLTEAVQERGNLRARIDAARDEYHESERLRCERLEILASEIVCQRRRLDELAGKIVDATGEVYEALMRQANDIDDLIERLTREQSELERTSADGLSDEDAGAIEEIAQRIAVSMEVAEQSERRELIELLRIRGTVTSDEDGVKLGRHHHFRIDWDGVIQLPDFARRTRVASPQ